MAQPTMSPPTMADYLQGRRTYGKGSVQTDEPPPPTRDDALVDLQNELRLRWLADQGRGAVAGVANPFGLTGWAARGAAYVLPEWMLGHDRARGFQSELDRWGHNAPVASGATSLLLPGYGAGRLAGGTAREAAGLLPYFAGIGASLGKIGSTLFTHDRMLTDQERARDYGAAGY